MTNYVYAVTAFLLLVAAVLLPGYLRHRKRCTCGHLKPAHQHYRAGHECALCDCPRWRRARRRKRYSATELADRSRDDIDPGWPEVRAMLPGYASDLSEVHRRLNGPPPTSCDPHVVRGLENHQREEGAR